MSDETPPRDPPDETREAAQRGVIEPFGALLQRSVERMRSADPEVLAAVERRRVDLAQRRDIERIERNIRSRNISPEAVDAARLALLPLTPAATMMFRALRWRIDAKFRERAVAPGPVERRPEPLGLVLVLAGGNGCGKTAAASWIVARWPRDAACVKGSEVAELADTDWSENAEVRAQWLAPELLVIDDVGAERSPRTKRHEVERIGPLLLTRHNKRKATIVTTNRPPEEFAIDYLTTEEPTFDKKSGAVVRADHRLLSRLSDGQLGRDGQPYWQSLERAQSYRTKEGAESLAKLAKVGLNVFERIA